jgi:hypothetical protein
VAAPIAVVPEEEAGLFGAAENTCRHRIRSRLRFYAGHSWLWRVVELLRRPRRCTS